ncbi:MAG TPA: PEGA domain-containing protein [Polyangia bacterium]|nr:PEGA domain-containing protein [Polyangia bacterium]
MRLRWTFAVGLLSCLSAGPVWAQAPAPGILVHVFGEAEPAGRIREAMIRALEAAAPVQPRDLFSALEPAGPDRAALDHADADLAEAKRKLLELEVPEARQLLERAAQAYELRGHRLSERPHALVTLEVIYRELSAARFLDGDEAGARAALRRALVLDPSLDFHPKIFPPQMRKLVTEARLLHDELGKSALLVESNPPGALVYVDGAARGRAPLCMTDRPAGPTMVVLTLPGRRPTLRAIELSGAEEKQVTIALERYPGADPLTLLEAARRALGEPALPGPVRALAQRAGVPMLALVSVTRSRAGEVTLRGYVYDVRPARLLKQVEQKAPEQALEQAGGDLASALLVGVRTDGVWVPPPAPPSVPLSERLHEFRHSRWFWPTVGAVGVAAAALTTWGVARATGGLSDRERFAIFHF